MEQQGIPISIVIIFSSAILGTVLLVGMIFITIFGQGTG
jgi:hypothetical protein